MASKNIQWTIEDNGQKPDELEYCLAVGIDGKKAQMSKWYNSPGEVFSELAKALGMGAPTISGPEQPEQIPDAPPPPQINPL